MADSGAERRPRRGPAPIASFDHDHSDESSPENKLAARLPEIREDPARPDGASLAPPEQRARSHSSPAVQLSAPAAPRIDISRASSSSHHDSRDSSPDMALFAGGGGGDERARLELGFREDGALELRSSTEELAFLEGAVAGPAAPPARRHSRKDSQGSEAALLAVSGRTSRLSSVGSQCSAHSALSAFSRASRLSAASGVSRSPSPHKMLLETSFCGPKPIDTDPDVCVAAVEERLLEIAKLAAEPPPAPPVAAPAAPAAPPPAAPAAPAAPAVDARDRREVRTEATVESARPASAPRLASPSAPPPTPAPLAALDDDKRLKETRNRAKAEQRRARPRDRSEPSQPEAQRRGNRSKDVIRIRLKPDDEYDDDDDDDESERTLIGEPARKPATLRLSDAAPARRRDSRTPSPGAAPASRKSSFCSLFKSRETVASPDSPCDALRRKKSLTEGRSRSKSRDRSATPTSAKIRGSVLALFKTPRRSAASPSPSSRDASPGAPRPLPQPPPERARGERLKYYEDAADGVIHIPLRTPPDELDTERAPRPASAPQQRAPPAASAEPARRTVLPDGSILIPLHSPTERTAPSSSSAEPVSAQVEPPVEAPARASDDVAALGPCAVPPPASPAHAAPAQADRTRRRERIVFTTHVGSEERVFSTQLSITKTPSVTSEISESIPSFPESEEVRPADPPRPAFSARNAEDEREEALGDDEIGGARGDEALGDDEIGGARGDEALGDDEIGGARGDEALGDDEIGGAGRDERDASCSPAPDAGRDSSGSEAGSEAGARCGSEAERRGLVVQESFEELPYVPTTLPLERSLALPMVPVRERGGVRVAALQRPRAARGSVAPPPALPSPAALPSPPAPPAPARSAPDGERLHIRLPRRARASSAASAAVTPPPRAERARSRSGGDAGAEARGKGDWIDFSEVPERRKQPKRIQTLPAAARDAVVYSYVPPERCRCECHAHAAHAAHDAHDALDAPDDELPLLQEPRRAEPARPH